MKNLITISAPSGSGKTTLCRQLQKNRNDIEWSVSYTTREKRITESDGRDYNFITKEQFEDLILNEALAEWKTFMDIIMVHRKPRWTPPSKIKLPFC